jgi:hypothetical protein
MLINTSLSPETGGLRNNRAADASPAPAGAAPQTPGADAAQSSTADSSAALIERRYSVALEEEGAPEISDAAGADQVTDYLRATFLSQPGTALAAQGNPNPETAYSLLI